MIIDVNTPSTFQTILDHKINCIVLCTNDKIENVLRFSIQNRIDYIDITKPTPALTAAYIFVKDQKINSRIVFGSGWMGGIVSSLIFEVEPVKKEIKEINLFVYYSIKDRAGESSAHFIAENVFKPFIQYKNNIPVTVKHFLNSENYTFFFEIGTRQTYNFDVPDLFILNQIEKIPTVIVKMAYSSKLVTSLLGLFQYLKLFNILSLRARRALFSANGKGDQTCFDIVIRTDNKRKIISLKSSKGQAELTAFSTVLNIEELMRSRLPNAVYFSHQLYQSADDIVNSLNTYEGITINIT